MKLPKSKYNFELIVQGILLYVSNKSDFDDKLNVSHPEVVAII